MNKTDIMSALYRFISQRSGMDYRNYNSRDSFMGDYKPMLRDGRDARALLRYVNISDGITSEILVFSSSTAFSGRLGIVERKGKVVCDYTTGQYFPTEYRKAACAVLVRAIRERILRDAPEPTLCKDNRMGESGQRYGGKRLYDYVNDQARIALGRSLARRFFY